MGVGWRLEAITKAAFVPDLWREMLNLAQFPLHHVARLISYPFVHGSPTHAVFAIVILLALGKFVGEVFRWWALLVVFFASAVVGAMVYGLVPDTTVPLFGAYPPGYGLIGAFTYITWLRLADSGGQYRAFSLIGMLLAVQLLFGVLFGGGWDWVADLTAFATGFLLSFVLAPGGFDRLRSRLRQR
jgi:membrane associated rhomboid family serine protease